MSEEQGDRVPVLVPVAEKRHDLPARTTSAVLLGGGVYVRLTGIPITLPDRRFSGPGIGRPYPTAGGCRTLALLKAGCNLGEWSLPFGKPEVERMFGRG